MHQNAEAQHYIYRGGVAQAHVHSLLTESLQKRFFKRVSLEKQSGYSMGIQTNILYVSTDSDFNTCLKCP